MGTNELICLAWWNISVPTLVITLEYFMLITSLGDNGVIIAPTDYSKFEALISDYFNDGDSASDESGNKDVECGQF